MKNNAVFVDTSGWIALLNRDDLYYQQATEVMRTLASTSRPILTTEWVIAETGNGLARTSARKHVSALIRTLKQSSRNRLISTEDELLFPALDMYDRSQDKSWGLVDCLSFVVMQNEDITDAFTVDRHFAQAGFNCLLQA